VPAEVSGDTASCAAIAKHAAMRANSVGREGRFPHTRDDPAIFIKPILQSLGQKKFQKAAFFVPARDAAAPAQQLS
jgi:hypothetical protein